MWVKQNKDAKMPAHSLQMDETGVGGKCARDELDMRVAKPAVVETWRSFSWETQTKRVSKRAQVKMVQKE
jgi:hypothetical protein